METLIVTSVNGEVFLVINPFFEKYWKNPYDSNFMDEFKMKIFHATSRPEGFPEKLKFQINPIEIKSVSDYMDKNQLNQLHLIPIEKLKDLIDYIG